MGVGSLHMHTQPSCVFLEVLSSDLLDHALPAYTQVNKSCTVWAYSERCKLCAVNIDMSFLGIIGDQFQLS